MAPMDPITLGLPHRAPFLFVDAVSELCPGQSAKAQKMVPASLKIPLNGTLFLQIPQNGPCGPQFTLGLG